MNPPSGETLCVAGVTDRFPGQISGERDVPSKFRVPMDVLGDIPKLMGMNLFIHRVVVSYRQG